MYADIIVDISVGKLDKTFQYSVPEELKDNICLGSFVVIPFGKIKKRGYVVAFSEEPKIETARIRDILGVEKDSVTIDAQMMALAAWMKENYGSTMNQAIHTVIPVKKKERQIEKKTVEVLLDAKALRIAYNNYIAKSRHSVEKQRLFEALLDAETERIPWEALTTKLAISSSAIRDFEKKGIVRVISTKTYRNPVDLNKKEKKNIVLNDEQKAAVDAVLHHQAAGVEQTYLLYGVTGSGKTQVYMELLADTLHRGKSAIVLIPEIALTYQTLMRFVGQFGDRVSFINSKMSPAERYDQFARARSGEISIMVGPRSALFTPFQNLGLIIIDEEHETSYKSETVPKYHARETAIARAKMAHASVVLGSATPSVESFARAKSGEYELLTLAHRAKSQPLPVCEVVDLREELRSGNRSILSGRLQELIEDRLQKKEQTMLFINRRGLLGFVSCRACGYVIKCPHCDVSLSLHNDGKMRCHYCGYETIVPRVCPSCGSKYIGGFKAGTQKFEEVVKERFPQARVLRMDFDTTKGKDGHQKILEAFANEEADILIGTQMIVKGHDFKNVTLVGALAADLSLNANDFHSAERTFALLTQAAGRAGRGEKEGHVIFQTYQPDHYAIQAAATQDYEAFFEKEISYRRIMSYPPAAHMLLVQVQCSDEAVAGRVATILSDAAKEADETTVCMGPTDAAIAKLNDLYRKIFYLKNVDYQALVAIKNTIEVVWQAQKNTKDATVWFDFDPMSGF